MKRLFTMFTLSGLLAGLVLFGLSERDILFANTSVPNHQASSSTSKAANSSASATIAITVYSVDDE